MTTDTYSAPLLHSSDAEFRAWGLALSNSLTAAGFPKSAALLAQMLVWFQSVLVQGAKANPTVQDRAIIRDNADESLTKTTGYMKLPEYTVAGLPDPEQYAWQMVGVTNEVGGKVVAFSDGTNWRRVTDRAIVS